MPKRPMTIGRIMMTISGRARDRGQDGTVRASGHPVIAAEPFGIVKYAGQPRESAAASLRRRGLPRRDVHLGWARRNAGITCRGYLQPPYGAVLLAELGQRERPLPAGPNPPPVSDRGGQPAESDRRAFRAAG